MQTTTTTENKLNPQEFVELADKTFLEYVKNGRYKEIVKSMGGLGDYSLRNQMLILQQFPTATKVNSMNGWNFHKRNIAKGSKSIKILAPVFDSVVTSDNGVISEKKADFVSGYKVNFVFDISQTEVRDSEKQAVSEPEDIASNYQAIIDGLKATLKSYTFVSAEIDKDGILDTRNRTITLKQGLTQRQQMYTLVDQIAAALVLGRDRSKFQGLRGDALANVNAIEISAVSSIVAARLGMENQNIQEPNFAEMSDDNINKFANNLGVVRSISQRMILAINNTLEEVKAQQKIAAIEKEATEVKTTVTKTTQRTTRTRKAQAEMG